MIELCLVFFGGALGSTHCIGMCGPFALMIGGGSTHWRNNLQRQLVYTLGRIFTYSFLGAVAGFAGMQLQQSTAALINAAAVLAVVAGLFLIYFGLLATGLLRRKAAAGSHAACLGSEFLATFLRAPGWSGVFLAGLFTGLLPCGLVYAFVALAASASGPFRGMAVMAAFGAGTAPIMMLVGCGSRLLKPSWRLPIHRIAAWCVVLTGLLSIARGAGFLQVESWLLGGGCPMCK